MSEIELPEPDYFCGDQCSDEAIWKPETLVAWAGQLIAAERERCARLAASMYPESDLRIASHHIAAAIRRGHS